MPTAGRLVRLRQHVFGDQVERITVGSFYRRWINVKMIYSSILDSRGRVTVPREVRHSLGLKTGDRVEFVVDREQIVLRISRSATGVREKYNGEFGTFLGGKKRDKP
jgi:AbrB family looped-hinge helix DNA binding protein